MTLCVAIKVPSKALNPKRRPLEFHEPGIVIASDSRYLWLADHQIQDDGMKLCPLSNRAIAGFSGHVELATSALFSMTAAITRNAFKDPELISRGTQKLLLHFQNRLKRQGEIEETNVLLGAYDVESDKHFLYFLSSTDGFNPSRRDGICSIGSGATGFQNTLENEIVHFSRQWSDPAISGYKLVNRDGLPVVEPRSRDDLIRVPLNQVALLLISSLDLHLEITNLNSIGGLVQCAMLTEKGIIGVGGKKSYDPGKEWEDITVTEVQSYFQTARRNPEIAHMNDDLTIQD